jgi:hypothetical protein
VESASLGPVVNYIFQVSMKKVKNVTEKRKDKPSLHGLQQ